MKIALVGAAGTGKTTLARDLAQQLRRAGRTVAVVPALLPSAHERAVIAQDHEQRVDAACAGAQVVIADTTALALAIQDGGSSDEALLHFALQRQREYELTLVTGLDLPCIAHGARERERVDELVRTLLDRASLPYRIVYGIGDDRLRNALAALPDDLAVRPASPRRAWTWQCDKCSDPDCEHRLFTSLAR